MSNPLFKEAIIALAPPTKVTGSPPYGRICPGCAPKVKCDRKGQEPRMSFRPFVDHWVCAVCRQDWTEEFLEECAPSTRIQPAG